MKKKYRLEPEFREDVEDVLNRLIEACKKCNETEGIEAAAYNLKIAIDRYTELH